MTVKEQLHRLVDTLPDDEARVARRVLEYLRDRGTDPLTRKLADAPEEDELIDADEEAAVEEGREDRRRGEVLSDEELGAALGL